MTKRWFRNFVFRHLIAIVVGSAILFTVLSFIIHVTLGLIMMGVSLTTLLTLVAYRCYINFFAKKALQATQDISSSMERLKTELDQEQQSLNSFKQQAEVAVQSVSDKSNQLCRVAQANHEVMLQAKDKMKHSEKQLNQIEKCIDSATQAIPDLTAIALQMNETQSVADKLQQEQLESLDIISGIAESMAKDSAMLQNLSEQTIPEISACIEESNELFTSQIMSSTQLLESLSFLDTKLSSQKLLQPKTADLNIHIESAEQVASEVDVFIRQLGA